MECRIRSKDKEYKLRVKKCSENFCEVEHNGETSRLVWTPEGVFLNGKFHETDVKKDANGFPRSVTVNGDEIELNVESVGHIRKASSSKGRPDEGIIRANLAGKIISISVAKGDEVKEGQLLLVLEAMKMENEIRSPFAGRVVRICSSQGKNVIKDEVLLELER